MSALLLFSCAPKNIQQLKWEKANETKSAVPKYYNSETKIAYEVTNDAQNLYLNILVNDKSTQRQIMMSGLMIWCDTTKKHNDNFGLNFPMKGRKPPKMTSDNSLIGEAKKLDEPRREQLNIQFRSINLNGFSDGVHNVKNTKGLKLEINFDENGYMMYTAKIPMECLHINSLSEVDSTDLFSLSINVPGVSLPSGQGGGQGGPPSGGGQGGGGQGGPPSGGGGGQGSRPSGGPGGSGGPSAMAGMTEDKVIKIRFRLNQNN